jgi:CubicO group peptidase (beta-lactamase class C family)
MSRQRKGSAVGDGAAPDEPLRTAVDRVAAETGFSGVVRVDRGDDVVLAVAYGDAHRAWRIANTVDTRFAIASGLKSLTALMVMSLIEDRVLSMSTTARSLLGEDLPLIDDDVTVEQLLAHRSGIGDYLDENVDVDINDYLMPLPVHELANAEDFLAVLDGFPTAFRPDERFAYCNGGYVVLAILAERAARVPYHDLVEQRVCRPATMSDTGFFRSDELPERTAIGHLLIDGNWRTNLLHLPVRGVGDGGIYTTAADIHALWSAMFAGRIVSADTVAEMVRPRSAVPDQSMRYGLGFWLLGTGAAVQLEGWDAGVSFRSVHDPERAITYTVLSNTSEGAWPLARLVAEYTQPMGV